MAVCSTSKGEGSEEEELEPAEDIGSEEDTPETSTEEENSGETKDDVGGNTE